MDSYQAAIERLRAKYRAKEAPAVETRPVIATVEADEDFLSRQREAHERIKDKDYIDLRLALEYEAYMIQKGG